MKLVQDALKNTPFFFTHNTGEVELGTASEEEQKTINSCSGRFVFCNSSLLLGICLT